MFPYSRRFRSPRFEQLETRQLLTTLPPGFEESVVVAGFNTPTSMSFTPDGRLFISLKSGVVRVVDTDGDLLSTPLISLPVTSYGETGLDGMKLDPNFATNGYVYLYYSKDTNGIAVNRLSRFKISASDPNILDPASEAVLIDGIQNDSPGYHNGGMMMFGSDGMLYLGIGDTTKGILAQNLGTLQGKVLRINPANYPNVIPSDNPFVGVSGNRGEIWAYGFRNPFTGNVDPVTGKIYVNDVGLTTWEEINELQRGGNYGWPLHEGIANDPGYIDPIYQYGHDPVLGAAITGGTFYNGTNFPFDYRGDYFFADYANSFIKQYDPVSKAVTTFTSDALAPVDLDIGPDGDLYWLSLADGGVRHISYTLGNHAPIVNANADVTSGLGPLTVQFNSQGTNDLDNDPLTYSWDFGDGSTSTLPNPTHIYTVDGTYNAVLTVSDGALQINSNPIRIVVGATAPLVTIVSPTASTTYQAGDTISFSGTAVDGNGLALPASAFEWSVVFHHLEHTHPFIPNILGVTSGSFQIPLTGEDSPTQWYRVSLQVTNTAGITSSRFVDVYPRTSNFTLTTNFPGLGLIFDNHPVISPFPYTTVENFQFALEAPASQPYNGNDYQFQSWSDGAPRVRTFTTPVADNTTTTAIYTKLTNDVQITATTDPAWYAGEVRTYNVTVKNLSTTTWSNTGTSSTVLDVILGTTTVSFSLPISLVSGDSATFPITVTAPALGGNYALTYRMRTGTTGLNGYASQNINVNPFGASYSVNPPTSWSLGEIKTYSITITNTSALRWDYANANPFKLGVYFGGASDLVGDWPTEPIRIALPNVVLPGASITMTISVQAPTTPGTYILRHRMVQELVSWFPAMAKTSVIVNNVALLSANYTVTPPASWLVLETKTYSITLTNTGSETWLNSGPTPVNLGVYFSGFTGSPPRYSLPSNVAPGQSVTLSISVNAPATSGNYVIYHRLVKETVSWFAEIAQNAVTVVNNPLSVNYAITPPTTWNANDVKTYNVTLTNTGSETWLNSGPTPVNLGVYFSGFTGSPPRYSLPSNVAPGQTVTLSITVQAPAAGGNYVLYHRLVKETVSWFAAISQTSVNVVPVALSAVYSVSPPITWQANVTNTYSITLTNVGTTTWMMSGTNPVKLGVYFDGTSDAVKAWTTEPIRYALPNNVAPGQSVTMSITVRPPTTAGSFVLRHRLVQENVAWFATLAKTTVTVTAPALAADYTVSPATTWQAEETKTYNITLKNTGTSTWLATGATPVKLGVYFDGTSDAVGAWTKQPTRYLLPNDVAPGQSVTISISVRSPTTPGTYTLRHRLVQEQVAWFTTMAKTQVNVTTAALAATYTVTPPNTWVHGQTLTYSISLTNTGASAWNNTGANKVNLAVYFSGTTGEPPRYNLPSTIQPGQSVTLTISVKAPATAGNYVLTHRMVKENIAYFTQMANSNVIVT